MSPLQARLAQRWTRIGTRFLPFADAASPAFGLGRMLRLALFQVSVGMALVLLNGTLNRIMIVEFGTPASLVALFVTLPVLFAPFRALLGHRSDHHRSALGWRRVPYLWMGTLVQFGGLAIMPFALILLSGDTHGPAWIGQAGAAAAFLLIGAGMHTVQTAGLALATDLAPEDRRPRVVCLLYVMLLVGMVGSSLAFGVLLEDFQELKLIRVLQGTAVLTLLLNGVALWKQEARRTVAEAAPGNDFRASWARFRAQPGTVRGLVACALGTAGFSMQDILLEPYGADVLHLPVASTTTLTALTALGTLCAFALAARWLERGSHPWRVAAGGAVAGVFAFALVVVCGVSASVTLFRLGAWTIGFGGGLFALGSLTAAMQRHEGVDSGMALGAWGATQATAGGLSMLLGASLKDVLATALQAGTHGAAPADAVLPYTCVYHFEIALLFMAVVAIGPLVAHNRQSVAATPARFGLAEFPG